MSIALGHVFHWNDAQFPSKENPDCDRSDSAAGSSLCAAHGGTILSEIEGNACLEELPFFVFEQRKILTLKPQGEDIQFSDF